MTAAGNCECLLEALLRCSDLDTSLRLVIKCVHSKLTRGHELHSHDSGFRCVTTINAR